MLYAVSFYKLEVYSHPNPPQFLVSSINSDNTLFINLGIAVKLFIWRYMKTHDNFLKCIRQASCNQLRCHSVGYFSESYHLNALNKFYFIQ